MTVSESQLESARSTAPARRVRTETLVMLVPAGVILALGIGLTALVRGDELLAGELAVARWLSAIDHSVLLAISEFLDFISENEVAPVLFVILLPLVWLAWGRSALVLFAISGSLTGVTRVVELADRARPTPDFRFDDLVKEAGIYPSGHVIYGVMVFGMIAYIAYRRMRPGLVRNMVITLTVAIAVLMGPSRIVELDHWPADVIGSYLLSIPFLLVLIWIDRHPATQSGGRIYALALYGKSVEDRILRRGNSGKP